MKRKVLIDDCIYILSKDPKFRVFMNGDIYDAYEKPSRAKVNAYKGNYIWFNGCGKDEKCNGTVFKVTIASTSVLHSHV